MKFLLASLKTLTNSEKLLSGGYQKAGTSFLERVTGRNFTISK